MKHLATCAALAGMMTASSAFAGGTIKFGHDNKADPFENPAHACTAVFSNILESGTNGSVDVEVFGSNQLGTAAEHVQMVRDGILQATLTSTGALASYYPRIDVLNLPFAFSDNTSTYELFDGAFGEALARLAGARVRDLSAEDRVAVMRLVERVSLLAEKLDGLMASDDVPRDGSAAFAFGTGQEATGNLREHRQRGREADAPSPVPGLPDPRRIRALIRKRQARARFFEAELFADPAWDILLDLTAARAEGRRVSVTSLCIASGVPPTTALRWIAQMTRQGLLRREEDLVDRRRAFIALSGSAVEAMARYFDATGTCDCAGI